MIIDPGYLKILEIPKEARHLLIQEFKGTPHILGKCSSFCPSLTSFATSYFLFSAPAVKNQETGHLFLNDADELPESRVVIEKGVAWEYNNTEEQESVQATGPLKYGVLVMVGQQLNPNSMCPYWITLKTNQQTNHHLCVSVLQVRSYGDSKVTVSYKYIIQDHLRSSLESNLVQEDTIFYEWALKKWSHCSKPCGGGTHFC